MLSVARAQDDSIESDPGGDSAYVASAKRNPEAFSLIYQRYERRIFAYCLRRLGDPDAAEDATSLIFARAFAKLGSCDPNRFRAWLFTIAHNTIADGFRGPKRLERPLDEALGMVDPSAGPERAALRSEAARELASLLQRLPTDQRRVVELRLAGLTGPEIASALGRSHDAVKKLQGRAIEKLRVLAAHTGEIERTV